MSEGITILFFVGTVIIQAAGLLLALRAVMIARTPQAAIGWGLALLVFPWISVPLFLIFGESRFSGYVLSGSGKVPLLDEAREKILAALERFKTKLPDKYQDMQELAEGLRDIPVLRGNSARLLVDGEETFAAIFSALAEARNYAVVQFYVFHDDELGRKMQSALLAAAGRGVRCWLLYDKVGAKGLPDSYVQKLRSAGVRVQAFVTNRQIGRRFQMNFRNHRKLVIVDGQKAFLGGLNVGDEYMGKGPLGPWRDTHMMLAGPSVQALQLSFLEDWYYVDHSVPDLPVEPVEAGTEDAFVFASGPTETWGVSSAVYCETIHDVRKRLWIASPYFVPDPMLRGALAHAALRGVDVRILLPQGIDHLLPWLTSYTYYPQMREAGVKIYRYQPGFMHQKVLLADDDLAIVGSVNLDYRSFMLNFELAAAVRNAGFAKDVEKMFEADFARSNLEDMEKFEKAGFLFRLKCRMASLMSPEQ